MVLLFPHFLFLSPIFSSHVTARKVCLLCVCAVLLYAERQIARQRRRVSLCAKPETSLCLLSVPACQLQNPLLTKTHTHFLVSKFGSRLLFFLCSQFLSSIVFRSVLLSSVHSFTHSCSSSSPSSLVKTNSKLYSLFEGNRIFFWLRKGNRKRLG